MFDVVSWVLSKRYTADSVIGLGAIKGASCTIQKIEYVKEGVHIIFEWKAIDGTIQTSEILVPHGTDVTTDDVIYVGNTAPPIDSSYKIWIDTSIEAGGEGMADDEEITMGDLEGLFPGMSGGSTGTGTSGDTSGSGTSEDGFGGLFG